MIVLYNNHNIVFMSVIGYIWSSLDNSESVEGIFIALKKTFDTVDHDIFIKELNPYDVRRISKDLLISYPHGRIHFVMIENIT